jgi:putative transposase
VRNVIKEVVEGFKDRYVAEVGELGFDQNHIHLLCRFLPKYSGGQVIRLIKKHHRKEVFKRVPSIKQQLWGHELWTDGYYIATIPGKGNKAVIENYIRKQGRGKDLHQLKLFTL